MSKKSIFRANGREFKLISEAKAEARRAMIGKACGEHVLVYEWQNASESYQGTAFNGFWEPVARAEYNKYMQIICK